MRHWVKSVVMRRGALVGLAALQLTCQAILTAPPGSGLFVLANPTFIPAHGGVSVISAHVIEPAGTPVPDGTVVQFFTTLGQIQEQGKTNDGVARVNLISDARSGTATVTATSGLATNTVDVTIGSALPTRVIVGADPPRITAESRSTHVLANVFDANGNPVANVPVFFSVTGSTETMDSSGRSVFTDNNGRAEDVMRTRHPRDAAPKTVTVTAITANGISGTATVTIN